MSTKKVLVEWDEDPRYKYLYLPWKGDNLTNIMAYQCYSYCLTAYLAFLDARFDTNISGYVGNYDALFEEISEKIDSKYSTYKKDTAKFLKNHEIPLTIKAISFKLGENQINESLLKEFIYKYMVPVIAILDYEALRQGRSVTNSNHSILLLGITEEGYIYFDPSRYEKINIEHKVNIKRAWMPKACEGLWLQKKGARTQMKRPETGTLTLDMFIEEDENYD